MWERMPLGVDRAVERPVENREERYAAGLRSIWSRSDRPDELCGCSDEGGDEKILWKCPFSENASIPPRIRWVPVDEWANGTPKVEYCSDYNLRDQLS